MLGRHHPGIQGGRGQDGARAGQGRQARGVPRLRRGVRHVREPGVLRLPDAVQEAAGGHRRGHNRKIPADPGRVGQPQVPQAGGKGPKGSGAADAKDDQNHDGPVPRENPPQGSEPPPGPRGAGSGGGNHYEFKRIHGFRKYFKTSAERAIKTIDVEKRSATRTATTSRPRSTSWSSTPGSCPT